ncbi:MULTISPECIES: MFS transporter [Streptomyces]|uniref:MFS transporter n=1 Tax=Streptomyces scabiei TaxID=1930 RepID=UPI001B312E7F|nr:MULTISPECIES: MFS transporter [Streptomyces]MBP5872120.1 MFS transporter [Streptomyces sp. LBUM 1485]MBP5895531.1 MFS transporter [Streptomyces sp. LBUM 1481]MBP5925832.1 MFS transporter [Streptomyces sp. LBUM 1483]MDX2684396.1 MFS transporter [Streptomyces scabiei]MDX2750337.1 MFS transporter [Streptomyces scabiei]
MKQWRALIVLGTAQFLMVLDTSVMNVSISQLVEDFDTEVTAIQGVITLYALVMAAFMIIGGRFGDIVGRRRLFFLGLVVYGIGSALTAVAPTLWVLGLGWSVIEGLGAAMVLPSMAALVAESYRGRDRAVAYGVIGGLAGAGIAVGPLLGGWVTTYLTWRLVFAGEVVVVVAMLCFRRAITESPRTGRRPAMDGVGAALSATGLALGVLGVLQSSTWGWVQPRNAPFTVMGFAPTLFVIGAGVLVLAAFTHWEHRRTAHGTDPLVHLPLLRRPALGSGLSALLCQNLILLGLFFTIPLYLQVVQGFDAFQTGLRLLPVSITMLASSLVASRLGRRAGPRRVVRLALATLAVAIVWLLATIDPVIDDTQFALAMALLGVGMGLLASQLGNVVQSSVGEKERSEVGGLQFTAQNLGSALGTALIGSLLIGALAHAFTAQVEDDPRLSQETRQQTSVALQAGIGFVPTDQVRAAAEDAGLPPSEVDALADSYATAQLNGLKAAILATGGITLAAFLVTPRLPGARTDRAPSPAAGGSEPPVTGRTPAAAHGSARHRGGRARPHDGD